MTRSVVRSRRRCAALAAVLAAGLAACAPGDGDAAGGGDAPESPSSGSAPADPGGKPSIPPGMFECGKPGDDKSLQLADLDLTAATWEMPTGFQETFIYHEENPVEEVASTWTAEPVPAVDVLNIVNVVIYTGLDWGEAADRCGSVPIEAIEAQLAEYNEQIGAEPMSEATRTTVAGHPALEQYIHLEAYDYHGYWLFSRDQLLHAYCQWTNEKELIEAGCAELIPSIAVPG